MKYKHAELDLVLWLCCCVAHFLSLQTFSVNLFVACVKVRKWQKQTENQTRPTFFWTHRHLWRQKWRPICWISARLLHPGRHHPTLDSRALLLSSRYFSLYLSPLPDGEIKSGHYDVVCACISLPSLSLHLNYILLQI